jgi:hypothetical protein
MLGLFFQFHRQAIAQKLVGRVDGQHGFNPLAAAVGHVFH